MGALFTFLLLVFLVCLILGLISPEIFKRFFKKGVNRKKTSLVFGIAVIICFILVGITSPKKQASTSTKNSTPNETTKPTTATTTEKTEVAQKPSAEQPKPENIYDKLWKALDESIKTRDGYSIVYVDESKIATLSRSPRDYYDETSVVKGAYHTLVSFGLKAFQIDGVDKVDVILNSKFTDEYGKSNEEKAVELSMREDEFNKYDWKGLAYQNVYEQMLNSCDDYYIHPAIIRNLNTDKLYLEL